jgi:hypothetical protein
MKIKKIDNQLFELELKDVLGNTKSDREKIDYMISRCWFLPTGEIFQLLKNNISSRVILRCKGDCSIYNLHINIRSTECLIEKIEVE